MTLRPIDAIHETTLSVAPGGGSIPPSMSKALKAFHIIHKIWRGSKTLTAVSTPTGFLAYVGGVGLNMAYGDRRGVKIAAQTVMIALRVVQCIEHFVALKVYVSELKSELAGHTILPMKPTWNRSGSFVFMSPSTHEYACRKLELLRYRIWRIAELLGIIFYRLFDLSMVMYDASQAFNIDNEHVSDNVNEIFSNGYQIWEKLTSDLPYLAQKIEENSKVIDVLMKKVTHTPLDTSTLLIFCRTMASVRDGAEQVVEVVGGAIADGTEKIASVVGKGIANATNTVYKDPKIRFIEDHRVSKPYLQV